jgi:hypothetical protein
MCFLAGSSSATFSWDIAQSLPMGTELVFEGCDLTWEAEEGMALEAKLIIGWQRRAGMRAG